MCFKLGMYEVVSVLTADRWRRCPYCQKLVVYLVRNVNQCSACSATSMSGVVVQPDPNSCDQWCGGKRNVAVFLCSQSCHVQ